jgi:hypothetical protein
LRMWEHALLKPDRAAGRVKTAISLLSGV